MYETVIWATDGSEGADVALREALQVAGSGARIVAVYGDPRLYGRDGAWSALAEEDDLRSRIGRRVEELQDQGIEIELDVRRYRTEAADVVAEAATELDADVIVCGTRGLGALTGAFLGSFTQRLLHIAPCPVLVVGPRSGLVATTRGLEADAARA